MKNYDKKVKQTRILLADYLLLKSLAQNAGVSMAEILHKLITREDHKGPVSPAQIRMPVTMAEVTPTSIAEVPIKSTIVKLRATVAGRGSTNGNKQV